MNWHIKIRIFKFCPSHTFSIKNQWSLCSLFIYCNDLRVRFTTNAYSKCCVGGDAGMFVSCSSGDVCIPLIWDDLVYTHCLPLPTPEPWKVAFDSWWLPHRATSKTVIAKIIPYWEVLFSELVWQITVLIFDTYFTTTFHVFNHNLCFKRTVCFDGLTPGAD